MPTASRVPAAGAALPGRPAPSARTALAVLVAAALAVTTGACSRAQVGTQAPVADRGPAAELRLGYLPNLTHAAALIGAEHGLFAGELGQTTLTTQTFSSGNAAVAALLGGSLDVAFLGPGPAVNAFTKSGGAVRLIAGAASGGAALVARPGIDRAEQLRGRSVATPQLGNTQDIALKKWLAGRRLDSGAAVGVDGGVTVVNADSPQILSAFRAGQVDAAWVPEPWASRLVLDAGGRVLVDERTLWPGGRFPTTSVVVRTRFLAEHRQSVQALLHGLLAAIDLANANPNLARQLANHALQKLTGKALPSAVIERALGNLTLDIDPLAATFGQLARDMVTAGMVRGEPNLAGLADLRALNAVLASVGRPAVDAAGLAFPETNPDTKPDTGPDTEPDTKPDPKLDTEERLR